MDGIDVSSTLETVRVEVRPPASVDAGDLSAIGNLAEDLRRRIDEITDTLNGVAESVKRRLVAAARAEQDWGLESIELSFSIDLEAEAGVIISRASSAAGFEAKLTWSRQR